MLLLSLATSSLLAAPSSLGTRAPPPAMALSGRRQACQLGSALAVLSLLPTPAIAADEPVRLYFGAGCFWHVQHEMVLHEALQLKRRGEDITAISGYAGGKALGNGDRVCYHNPMGLADYGSLGHAEVVEVSIGAGSVSDFASKYFSLFGTRGYRHDPQDRGGEYRSVIGLPGGLKSPLYAQVSAAAEGTPMSLIPGKGDEDDTLAAKSVLVMDSNAFPFYPAELYHQFHNDFQGPAYGVTYNGLQQKLRSAGRIAQTGCPDIP